MTKLITEINVASLRYTFLKNIFMYFIPVKRKLYEFVIPEEQNRYNRKQHILHILIANVLQCHQAHDLPHSLGFRLVENRNHLNWAFLHEERFCDKYTTILTSLFRLNCHSFRRLCSSVPSSYVTNNCSTHEYKCCY